MADRPARITPVPREPIRRNGKPVAPKKAKHIEEQPVSFTPLERLAFWVDEKVETGKAVVRWTPPFVTLLLAIKMKSSTKLATAITGLIMATLGHFAVDLPDPVPYLIDTAVAGLVMWLVPAPKGKTKEEAPTNKP